MEFAQAIKNWILFLLFLLLTWKSGFQTNIPSEGMLCISECGSCPVICSSPPVTPTPILTPTSPTPTPPSPSSTQPRQNSPPTLPPPHHEPPTGPYYFDLPPPPVGVSHPPPSPRPPSHPPASTSGTGSPPPPRVYVYTGSSPDSNLPPTMGQRNFTYPYYNFYTASKASCSLPDLHQGYVPFLMFLSFQTFVSF